LRDPQGALGSASKEHGGKAGGEQISWISSDTMAPIPFATDFKNSAFASKYFPDLLASC
jgi:hypothetical protein